jgi:hypothetical protein
MRLSGVFTQAIDPEIAKIRRDNGKIVLRQGSALAMPFCGRVAARGEFFRRIETGERKDPFSSV